MSFLQCQVGSSSSLASLFSVMSLLLDFNCTETTILYYTDAITDITIVGIDVYLTVNPLFKEGVVFAFRFFYCINWTSFLIPNVDRYDS